MSKQLFTIGHSNLSIEYFIRLLHNYEITVIADVRSHPYSSYFPRFNQDSLKFELLKANIKYVFLGEELGARPKDLSCYINGKVVYAKIVESKKFKIGIKRLLKGLEDYRIALMCSEKDPISCHRTILICRYLHQLNLQIDHIIDENILESNAQLEKRLLELHGFDATNNELKFKEIRQFDLLDLSQNISKPSKVSREEFLERAYIKQESKIAYLNKKS